MDETTMNETGTVTGGVRTLLRLEGLVLFLGMTLLYEVWGGSWWVYFILFLAPDLSFAGYLAGPKEGAIIYNTHSRAGAGRALSLLSRWCRPLAICVPISASTVRSAGLYAGGFDYASGGSKDEM